ncbi:response regulator, partial [bacterium]|nr:response regulator [bacterium]
MAEEGKTILIVDDEEEIRENLFDFLEYKGFTPLEAEHGLDALQKLQEYTPDLILSDLMMPQMGGMDFLRALKERKIDIPVVIMTAFGTVEYAIDAMKNGAVDFLTKPIDLPYTMQVIDRVIQRSELERKVREQQRQMEEDLSHAAMIQCCLLPDPIVTDFVSLQYRFEPLIEIGGDYLTVHKYHDKKVAAALYDVSGHGVSAALTGSLIHNQLMMSLEEERSGPAEILDALNKAIIHRIGKTGMFITIILALIDLDTYT